MGPAVTDLAQSLRFARCPECRTWKSVVRLPAKVKKVGRMYRTRRHEPCGIVRLPADVELRDL